MAPDWLVTSILSFMTMPISTEDKEKHPEGPNFPLIVALAGITLALLMIAAVIFLAVRGKKDLPLNHQHHTQAQVLEPITNDTTHYADMYWAEIIIPSALG